MKKGTAARLIRKAAAPKTVVAAGTRLENEKPAWMDWTATRNVVARSAMAAGRPSPSTVAWALEMKPGSAFR